MKKLVFLCIVALFFFSIPVLSQVSEEKIIISGKEIAERLTRLEEGQKALNKRIDDLNTRLEEGQKALNKRIDDLNTRLEEGQKALNKRIDDTNKRIDDLRAEMNRRFDDVNKSIDILMWIMGLFVTISLVILGAVVRIQWQMGKRLVAVEKETTLIKEIFMKMQDYMKTLIEAIKPPKDVL